jgi:PAS domain S-box-containing protein
MESGALKLLDVSLYRRGLLVSALTRGLAVCLALVALAFVWEDPRTRRGPAVAVVGGYALFTLAAFLASRGPVRRRFLGVAQDMVDALAAGLGAAFSGGMDSPVWLLLYPHVVGVSVRGGLPYALLAAAVDAAIVITLAQQSPGQPLALLHALGLVSCGLLGGTASSYLGAIQDKLSRANQDLVASNVQLSESVAAHESSRREQEAALALLRGSEARYQRLLERIQDGVLIIRAGRVVFANQVFGAMVGESPEALVGTDFRDLVPPEDRPEISERYRRWEETQAVSGVLESRLLTRQGEIVLVSVRAGAAEFGSSPGDQPDGEGLRSVVATIRDITRERRMEQDVKAHAERLAAINEIANAVNLSLTIEDIFAVVAEEAQRLLPFDRLTIALAGQGEGVEVVTVGRDGLRRRTDVSRDEVGWLFHQPRRWCDGDSDAAPPYLHRIMEDGVRAVATVPLISKEQVVGSLNLGRLLPTRFANSDLSIMEPVARHIGIALANARLLETVRRRGREFETLLDIGHHVVGGLDLAELLPLVTHSVNRVMGTRHCLLLLLRGNTLELAAHEGLQPEVAAAFEGLQVSATSLTGWVIQHGRPLAVVDMAEDPRLKLADMVRKYGYRSFLGVPLRRGTETLGTLEVVTSHEVRAFGPEDQARMTAFADQAAVAIENARLSEDARRHLAGVVQANRQLEELDRLRREYLRNVSHEFRTPLTVIKGYAEFLRGSGSPGEEALREVMHIVVESSDRVIDLVDTLLDVSRLEQEGAERTLNMQVLDLREVVQAVVESLRTPAGRKDIELAVDFPAQELALMGDRGLLQQVARKLVENAVKYSPPGQGVHVRGRTDGDDLLLEVQDFGIGISPEHVPRIFEKFYMVDGGITRRAGGTGVGLYLVREIVRLHGGRLDVASRPGQGSLFSVRLPRHQPAQTRAALA